MVEILVSLCKTEPRKLVNVCCMTLLTTFANQAVALDAAADLLRHPVNCLETYKTSCLAYPNSVQSQEPKEESGTPTHYFFIRSSSYPKSFEYFHPGLDLFNEPPTQTAVEERQFVEVAQ